MNFDEWINEKSLRQTISHKDVCDFINEGAIQHAQWIVDAKRGNVLWLLLN